VNRKPTQFGLQLREKQKRIFHYGLREEKLRCFMRKARSLNTSNWMESPWGCWNEGLIISSSGLTLRSLAAARQLVSHGHVLVNGRIETVGSIILRPGAVICLTDKASQLEIVQSFSSVAAASYAFLSSVSEFR
jgi:small subunit ribosomal protein S4